MNYILHRPESLFLDSAMLLMLATRDSGFVYVVAAADKIRDSAKYETGRCEETLRWQCSAVDGKTRVWGSTVFMPNDVSMWSRVVVLCNAGEEAYRVLAVEV